MQYNLVQYENKEDLLIDAKKSLFAPYQLSVKFTVFPMSNKYRFLINHSTGSGKTITSLLVAKNFIDYNLNVFVITFNQTQFMYEMQTKLEFGFISQSEYQLINIAQKDQQQKEQADKIIKQINKRIRNKITFIGYRELFLNIFGTGETVNRQMINRFKGSLIICDEIHNIYNHTDKNIYGVSIQFLSYILGSQVHMLFLSATPISYSGELGSLLSIMQVDQFQSDQINEIMQQIERRNTFKSQSKLEDEYQGSQIESKVELIQKLIDKLMQSLKITNENVDFLISSTMKDKVSFVPEIQAGFPKTTSQGIEYKAIPNIMIQRCVISPYFKKIMTSSNYFQGDESSKSIIIHPTENFYQVVLKLQRQDPEMVKWAKANQIELVDSQFNQTVSGPFLKSQNIGNYSPKLGFLIGELLKTQTKSFIYINKLKGFGVDILIQLLLTNGILIGDSSPNNQSICFTCKQIQMKHTNEHIFMPYRAVILTGSNISEGERFLKLFNSTGNITNPKYHIMIGNIKMKEGYNVLAVNNMYVLTLPYNITNFIQVLGRCVRNQSHADLPPSQQYVNTYLLVNSGENSDILDKEAFVNLKVQQEKSQFFGQITREEMDIWEKNTDFQLVQYFEAKIHEQSIDAKYFHPMYFKSQKKNGNIHIETNNKLKMTPFDIEEKSLSQEFDIQQDLSDFYLLNINQLINNTIKNRLQILFYQQNVWQIDDLVNSILKYPASPNLSIVPREVIVQKIFTSPNTYIVNNFAIYSLQKPQLDFFLPQTMKSPATIIQSSKRSDIQINQKELVILYEIIKNICPQYINIITKRQVPKPQEYVKRLDDSQIKEILGQLNKIFGKSQLSVIQEQYKKQILRYNDQELKKSRQQDASSVMFLAVANFLFPFTFQSQSQLQKTKFEDRSRSVIDSLILNGYILDLNTQVYINPHGEQSNLTPQREKIFNENMIIYTLHKKEFKISKISVGKDNLAKYSGNTCMNLKTKELVQIKPISNVSKQEHCDSILYDYLQVYFSNILNFIPFYNVIFLPIESI